MKVLFDDNLKIAGLAIVPWYRLGLEKWFKNYQVISLYNWNLDNPNNSNSLPHLFSLYSESVINSLKRLNSYSFLRTPQLQAILNNELSGFDILTYKYVDIPDELSHTNFLMAESILNMVYENKIKFRELFSGLIQMPDYLVITSDNLQASLKYFEDLKQKFNKDGFVIQDDKLSGSKGTFLVKTFDDYVRALDSIQALNGRRSLVLSNLINQAQEITIQCCITNDEIYVGPLQRQIVSQPELCNISFSGDKFCGVSILQSDQDTAYHKAAQEVAQKIGKHMQADGYRGVFGLDFLLSEDGTLFLIEANPRLTGATPLLNMLYQPTHIPFQLLHTLELGKYPYEIIQKDSDFKAEGGFLLLHSRYEKVVNIKTALSSGVYEVIENNLYKVSDSFDLNNVKEGCFVIHSHVSQGMKVKPNGRLLAVYFKYPIIDNNTNKLYNQILQITKLVYSQIEII